MRRRFVFPIGDDNSRRSSPALINYLLIAVNVLVFLYEISQPDVQGFILQWGAVPRFISHGERLVTLISSMFLHGGWMHLIGNMVFLYVFGDNVEDAFGRVPYLIFYLLVGIAAGLAQVFLAGESKLPGVGASGAISGVMAAYLLMFAGNRVRVFVFYTIITVPAFVMIGLWIVMQFFNGVASMAHTQQTGGIAYAAHIGGFIAGLLLTPLMRGAGRRRMQMA
jgi:membrane associated rhomboid family serine protease